VPPGFGVLGREGGGVSESFGTFSLSKRSKTERKVCNGRVLTPQLGGRKLWGKGMMMNCGEGQAKNIGNRDGQRTKPGLEYKE